MDPNSINLDGIAIIGLSGRLPGAKNVEQFWQNLVQGKDCISRFQADQLEFSVVGSQSGRSSRRTVSARGILEDVEQFDAEFFGIYPKEAEIMDPQHRVFLECAWESLELAGYNPFEYSGMIGVFASSSLNTYLLYNLSSDGKFAGRLAGNYQVGEYQAMLGNDKDFMPTRVSYKLNLKGPSMSIQTACSSSLVAISQACSSLLSYGCDMALAGGVSITFPQRRDYLYEEDGLASSDGFCRTFDAAAKGTVFGHGCGVLLLKRLSDAVADGDTVLAVIKGTAINNDGFDKIGFAAPSVNAQAEVIAMAQATANVSPESISYIEAHGTGTPLGDPIEIAALTKAFRDGGAYGNRFCAIGTCKPNISHLDVAAGAVGVIKTVMQLQKELIPPLLHFSKPNPNIDFENSPFYPVTEPTPWVRGDTPRRAGISAFGVGGTNAHVIIEESPPQSSDTATGPFLLPLSARNQSALDQMRTNLATHLEQNPEINLADVAYTLQVGRKAFQYRTTVAGSDRSSLIAALRAQSSASKKTVESDLPIVFLFPGQGAQYLEMGRELYLRESEFRQAVDQCSETLIKHLNLDIRKVLYPQTEADRAEAQKQIDETSVTQPVIFVIEYAMAKLWMSWGIKPTAVVGHSIGEYVCAVLAGTFSIEDALALLSTRARLMQALPSGSMLGVRMSAGEIEPILPDGLSIAADNSIKLCTVSGPTELIETFKQQLETRKIACRLLATSHAFHSAMMDAMLDEFAEACQKTTRKSPSLAWISTCTGQAITDHDIADATYWSRQLRQTVRFADAISTVVMQYPSALFVEVGPGQALSQFVRQHPANVEAHRITASMVQVEDQHNDHQQALNALGKLWVAGAKPNWSSLHQGQRRLRIPLPTYPFQRSAFWIDRSRAGSALQDSNAAATESKLTTTGQMPPGACACAPDAVNSAANSSTSPSLPGTPAVSVPATSAAMAATSSAAISLSANAASSSSSACSSSSAAVSASNSSATSASNTSVALAANTSVASGATSSVTSAATSSANLQSTPAPAPAAIPVKEKIAAELRSIILNLSGNAVKDDDATFIDMGFDSLFLAQASQAIDSRFGVKITFRQLLGDLSTIKRIAALLETKVPAEMFADVTVPQQTAAISLQADLQSMQQAVAIAQPAIGSIQNPGDVQRLLDNHVQTLQKLLEASRRSSSGSSSNLRTVYKPAGGDSPANTKANEVKRFGPYKPLEKGEKGGLTDHQQKALDRLIERYVAKTRKSKAYTAEHRPHFADPRAVAGFRSQWKEMVYPIVSSRSKGSRLWDLDGNEYIDITMGFGTYFFGHSPDWLIKAIEKQLHTGIEIGPQSPLAGRVAKKISEFTGLQRVTFCNTGSEAVMAAMRLARTVTGRDRIVYFSGDYHGMFEEVLVRGAWPNGQYKAQPIAPGMPASLVENMLVLDYGSPEALEIIRQHGDEIAAVMVEPVQSRNPALQPREFMHQVRDLTRKIGAALIFDEVVTGFRCHPGGAQAYFGVQADMATYGKVVGGGMPIGILAGSPTFMDALDGGQWQYGDDSFPEVGMTFFAGTFVRHPLAIAAADAVLDYLKQSGPELQESMFRRVTKVCEAVNKHMEDLQVPIRMSSFSAFAAIDYASDLKFASLLWYYMREKGIHIWEGRPCYFTTAHTDADLNRFVEVFRESVQQMQADGFLPQRNESSFGAGTTGATADVDYESSDRFPLAQGQREMWLGAQMSPEAAGPHHACNAFVLEGPLDVEALRKSLNMVVQRHEGLRCTFSEDGSHVVIKPQLTIDVPLIDLSNLDQASRQQRLEELMLAASRTLFDLTQGPLLAAQLVKLASQEHQLIVVAQMIACDGWSHHVLFEELSEIYSSIRENRSAVLRPVVPMRRYALWQREYSQSQASKDCEQFWHSKFQSAPAPLDLPTKSIRPLTRTVSADRRDLLLAADFYEQIKQYGRSQKSSSFAVLLSAFQVWLHKLSGAQDIVVGVPFAEQNTLGFETLVGQAANTLPIRGRVDSSMLFSEVLKNTWESLLDAQENTHFTFGRLVSKLDIANDPSRIPLVSVIFNIDPSMTKVAFSGLKHRFFAGPRVYYQFDLGFNLVEEPEGLRLECDFNTNLFDSETVKNWLEGFETLLRQIVHDGSQVDIRSLSLLSDSTSTMLAGPNIGSEPTEVSSVIQVLSQLAQAQPDALAISDGQRSLTRVQLVNKIDAIAQVLHRHSKERPAAIAIAGENSINLCCTLLAALKLGATVAAISLRDKSASEIKKLRRITSDMILVGDPGAIELLASPSQRTVALADLEAEATSGVQASQPDSSNSARLLLTSSLADCQATLTVAAFEDVMRRMVVSQSLFQLTNDDTAALTSPVGTIESIMQLLIPLCSGSQVQICPVSSKESILSLTNWLSEKRITWLNTTPMIARKLSSVDNIDGKRMQIALSQQVISEELVAKLAGRFKTAWHLIGLAECCGWVSYAELKPGKQPAFDSALGAISIAVVDEDQQIVPVGVPGRLAIAGAGLASGYHAEADLTAKRFFPSLASTKAPTLLTNLWAKRLPDGQVKLFDGDRTRVLLAGKDVDLAAIEQSLRQHSAVVDAAVLLRDDVSDQPKLIAYLATTNCDDLRLDEAESRLKFSRQLKQSLRNSLGSHSVPAAFVYLPELPTDICGQIDHAKLLANNVQLEDDSESDQPSTPTQRQLTEIWCDVLKLDKVGTDDNFFQLGGQSLQAVKLFARIEELFKRKLPLATLFHSPTISQLAAILDDHSGSKDVSWSSLIPIQHQGTAKPLFLVHGAGGNVLLYQALSQRLAPNYPLYGLQSVGLDGQSPPLHTIEEMASHYLKEIRAIQPNGPYYLGGYCLGGTIAYEMAQQLHQAGEKVALVAMLDTYNFSLALKSSLLGFLLQKIRFHFGNIIGLRPKHLIQYIKEKFRVARDGEFANLFTSRPGFDVEAGRATSGVELKIQTINDTAAESYRPKPYAGKLTLLKPHINYKFYPDPKMGWENLALGGLDIVEFPFNPHAMLVEPYVEKLADALIARLQDGMQHEIVTESSAFRGEASLQAESGTASLDLAQTKFSGNGNHTAKSDSRAKSGERLEVGTR